MESLAPNLFVSDIMRSRDFYLQLGFKVTMSVPDETSPVWLMLMNGNVTIILQTNDSLGEALPQINRKKTEHGSLLLYINVKGIGDLFASLEGKVHVLKGLNKTFYGATEFCIEDPDGFILTFAEDE